MRLLACTVLTACGHAVAVPTQQSPTPPAPPTAAELLSTVAATYSAARTYVDHGVHRVVYSGHGAHETTLQFQTAFVRGEHFRFEYRQKQLPANTLIIWSDFQHTYTDWTARPGRRESSLELALAGATGVSGGTAHTVPRMLMGTHGRSLAELTDVRLDGSETIEGHPCWRLVTGPRATAARGELPATHAEGMTLWIDQRTHLLVRIFERTHFDGPDAFVSEATTTYEPTLDQPVDPALLGPI